MTWRPILDGDLAARAHEAIDAIGRGLADSFPAGGAGASAVTSARQASLGFGRAGVALFSAYHRRAGLSGEHPADRLISEAIERAAKSTLGVSLCEGLAGIGWTAAHLASTGLGAAELHAEVEASVECVLAQPATPATPVDYDLLYGLVGFGVYALERLPDPGAAALLARIIERLAALAEYRAGTVTWWTPPVLTDFPAHFTHGWYNLGVAHGVPSIIALLALACRAGVAMERARPLLDGAVAWLLDQRLPGPVAFPRYVGAGIEPHPARLGWCYGDLSIAATLLVAARAVERPAWEQAAVTLALLAARRDPETASVVDAPLCHGAIGVGHLSTDSSRRPGNGLSPRRPTPGSIGGWRCASPAGSTGDSMR